MQLGPAQGGRAISVLTGRRRAHGTAGNGLVCRLRPALDWHTGVQRMERIAAAVAEQSLARGGLLLHGALLVRDGHGFVLAGPSGAGKSTACRRLPSPWQSLSDDCVLVLRDAEGVYWAHPWPTWSFLRENGPVASWPVEQAVPLKALLFLKQSSTDRIEPVGPTPATALIMESAVQLARAVVLVPEDDARQRVCLSFLRAARALAAAAPAHWLNFGLTGEFWKEIEQVSPPVKARARAAAARPRLDLPAPQTTPAAASRGSPGRGDAGSPDSAALPGSTHDLTSLPVPRLRLLPKGQRPRLVRFQARQRTFLKLVAGRRVIGSVDDVLGKWHVHRPARPSRGRARC